MKKKNKNISKAKIEIDCLLEVVQAEVGLDSANMGYKAEEDDVDEQE